VLKITVIGLSCLAFEHILSLLLLIFVIVTLVKDPDTRVSVYFGFFIGVISKHKQLFGCSASACA